MIGSKLNFAGSKAYSALFFILFFLSCARPTTFKAELLADKIDANKIANTGLRKHSLPSVSEAKPKVYPEQLLAKTKKQKTIKIKESVAAIRRVNKLIKNNSTLGKPENKKATVERNPPGISFLEVFFGLILILLGLLAIALTISTGSGIGQPLFTLFWAASIGLLLFGLALFIIGLTELFQ